MNRAGQITARWLKFNAVGGIGIIVQLTVLSVLTRCLKMDYLPATLLAVETTIIHNFLWHERFTWADKARLGPPQNLLRWLKFNAGTGSFSLAGNLVLMRFFVGTLHWHFLFSNVVTIAACSIMNFLISEVFVFRSALGPKTASLTSFERGKPDSDAHDCAQIGSTDLATQRVCSRRYVGMSTMGGGAELFQLSRNYECGKLSRPRHLTYDGKGGAEGHTAGDWEDSNSRFLRALVAASAPERTQSGTPTPR